MLAALRSPAGRMCVAGGCELCLRDVPVSLEARNLFRHRSNGYPWQARSTVSAVCFSFCPRLLLTYLWQANVCFEAGVCLGFGTNNIQVPVTPLCGALEISSQLLQRAWCVLDAGARNSQTLHAVPVSRPPTAMHYGGIQLTVCCMCTHKCKPCSPHAVCTIG